MGMSTPIRKSPQAHAALPSANAAVPAAIAAAPAAAAARAGALREIGGRAGAEPTRFGDWEKNGRCIDF
jgi:hypothetical protein